MISVPHPICLLITNQYQFLSSMFNRFPSLLNNWIDQHEKEVNKLANIESGGDFEVYSSIYHSEISRVDSCYDEMQLFYQALLIMAYSYYESILSRIAKEETVKERPSCIAHKYGIGLNGEYSEISEYIHHTILPLRNQLCHNNNGTLFARNKDGQELHNIKILVSSHDIEIEGGRIYIKRPQFIQDILDKEYKMLLKLADICCYNTKYI